MTTSKDLFLKDKELSSKWNAISKGEIFETVLIYARGAFMQQGPSHEEILGAEKILHVLCKLSENDDMVFEFPSPGLHHMTEPMPKKPESKE